MKKDKEEMDDKDKEILKKCEVDRSWANWLSGYLIYAGVLAKGFPGHCVPLLQNLDVVCKAYPCFTGMAWMLYDEQFRMRAALNSALCWDEVCLALWLKVLPFARPNLVKPPDLLEVRFPGHAQQKGLQL